MGKGAVLSDRAYFPFEGLPSPTGSAFSLWPDPQTLEEAKAMPSIYHWRTPRSPFQKGGTAEGTKIAGCYFPKQWRAPLAVKPHEATHEVILTARWEDGRTFTYEGYYMTQEGACWGLELALFALSLVRPGRKTTAPRITAYAGARRHGIPTMTETVEQLKARLWAEVLADFQLPRRYSRPADAPPAWTPPGMPRVVAQAQDAYWRLLPIELKGRGYL